MSEEEREKPEEGGEGGDPASELAEELSKPVPEEEEEGQTFELSPEQAEKLRPMARIQEVLSPKLDFKPLDVLGKRPSSGTTRTLTSWDASSSLRPPSTSRASRGWPRT